MIALIIIVIVCIAIGVEFKRQRTYSQAEFERQLREMMKILKPNAQIFMNLGGITEETTRAISAVLGVPAKLFKNKQSSNYQSAGEVQRARYTTGGIVKKDKKYNV